MTEDDSLHIKIGDQSDRMEIMKATLRVADAIIQGHLMSAFSSAEGVQQMLGVRKAIAAALNE